MSVTLTVRNLGPSDARIGVSSRADPSAHPRAYNRLLPGQEIEIALDDDNEYLWTERAAAEPDAPEEPSPDAPEEPSPDAPEEPSPDAPEEPSPDAPAPDPGV